MANKIKCTCGHSWNKSDSSKKDMYVCHVCGNSNVPKAQVGDDIPASKVTPEMIKGWEEYRNYLDAQGLYGDSRLNTAFGKKTFIDWATKNPSYGVNWETLPLIGEELGAQKKNISAALKKGSVSLDRPISELNPTDVTNAKSKNPWWPGTEFTSQGFTEHVEQILDPKGKVIKEQNFGVLPSTETYDKPKLIIDKKDIPVNIVKSIAKQKSGGWLDRYDEGGEFLGTTNKGFNYNGAWGGPSMQNGGDLTFLEPTSRKLPKGHLIPYADSSTELAVSIGGENGEPAYLVPSFKYGKRVEDPKAEFRRTGEHLGGPFKTYQEADEWERTVRHPYVEKGQTIPTPIKRWGDMAMGGSLPGSVGFTYARTGDIPSNGPYAKKTKASAQNGMEMSFYQNGLDWTPKNISMNGSKLKKAQLGTHMLNPFSSTLGNNMMEMLSVPQKALTALFSGKYQDPSEAMGIQNPYGAFAIDAILDPTNLVGAGLAKKMLIGTKAAQKVSRMDHLKELVKMKQEGVDLSKFFEDLNWTQKGKDLWKEASKYNVNILTGGRELAPGQDAISTGKRLWSKKNLNLEGDNIIVEKQKAKYANPNVILVDDLKDNVNKFREAGGHAILHTDTKKTIKELNKHMAKNPDHKVYMDLDGVLVDLEGGVHKFRGKKKNGDMINKAQNGIRQRAASDNTRVATPLIKELLTMDEAKKQEEANRFWNAVANQPVIQSPKGKQLTREQILQKNKEYAEAQGKRFDPNSGAVTPFLSPSAARAFDRANESVLNTANAAFTVPTKLVQSAYKPGYTAADALIGKPSGSSLTEDIVTDPGMIASLGGKGVLTGLLKGALAKGAIGKGMLSSALLPFYKTSDPAYGMMQQFTSKLNQVKDMVTSPEARDAFRRVGDIVTRDPNISALDEAYANAITNPNLPELAIDKYANSILSIDPAEHKLSPEQLKYLNKITGLATDVGNIENVSNLDRLNFLIDNSQKMSQSDIAISPRDMLPFFYGNTARGITNAERQPMIRRLYDLYGGANTINPLAEQSAAADLFTLADNYSSNSSLAEKIGTGIKELGERAVAARPRVHINDPYFKPRWSNENVNSVIGSMFGKPYSGIPTRDQRSKQAIGAARKALAAMNEVLNDPLNRGRFFTGSKSLSSDSQPLSLSMIAAKKDVADIVPIHLGEQHQAMVYSNPAGGLSRYNYERSNYLDKLKEVFDRQMGPSNYSSSFFESPANRLQKQTLEAQYFNTHLDKFNQAVGTNLPSALYSDYQGFMTRPNVGIIVRKDGGPVKDNMGYWNPENWGEPVEIGSNNITMEGVYEPLIGVSDEGDVQYMRPGENYKFKGKKVTEYPVKKKSGGWLDKYK